MSEYHIVKITERPEMKEKAANWFHEKWGIPTEAYLASMEAADFYERYGWEYLCMVQGDGEPEMSRMYIHR
jgi:hypothetical protein